MRQGRGSTSQEKEASQPAPIQGQGSGFFISPDGYIVTNHHVVDGAIKVEIVTESGEIMQARIVGTDPSTDLALLKVEGATPFPYVPLGRTEVKPGDWVIAIGNPFGLGGTVTAGIVSARGRDIGMGAYDNFVQIDAPDKQGQFGRPGLQPGGRGHRREHRHILALRRLGGHRLCDPRQDGGKRYFPAQIEGRVRRGWLGVQVQAVTPEFADSLGLKEAKGALVSVPTPDSPAEAAGIRRGDVIVKIAGEDVKDSRDLARKIAAASARNAGRDCGRERGQARSAGGQAYGTQRGSQTGAATSRRVATNRDRVAWRERGAGADGGKGGAPKGLAVSILTPMAKAPMPDSYKAISF